MLIDAWFLGKDMRPLSSSKHLGVAWPSVSMAKIDLSNDQQILTSFLLENSLPLDSIPGFLGVPMAH